MQLPEVLGAIGMTTIPSGNSPAIQEIIADSFGIDRYLLS